MCSISGIVGGTGVEEMIDVQTHRAPDEWGVYKDEFVEIGMGRLKIIDLVSPGLAPYQEGDFVLSYNGEIYNYIELRKELTDLGWIFKTTSDTEVLMKAWRQWGTNAFDKFNGMFGVALYDKKQRKLYLARDIAGEKPLYYSKQGNTLYFASEAKAIHKVAPTRPKEQVFYSAFQHCYVDTLWEHVYAVPPAHYIEYDIKTGNLIVHEYWKLNLRSINPKTAVRELEELLEDSVRIRTRADVPYGLYYSKGIDSSIVREMHAFKHEYYFDDTLDWKDDFFEKIPSIVKHLDFPVGSLSSYPLWKLAEQASREVKVVLSGEGADEVFGGYVRYLPVAREWELEQSYPSYGYLFGKHMSPYIESFARVTARSEDVDFVRETIRPYFEQFNDPVNAMGFVDFKLVMPSLLQMGDRMSSAFGMENRCPFLDRRVIEFGFSLPSELKINGLEQKVMLRKILQRRKVSGPLEMEKKGLTISFNKWLGDSDWDRSKYFNYINDHWKRIYHAEDKDQSAKSSKEATHTSKKS